MHQSSFYYSPSSLSKSINISPEAELTTDIESYHILLIEAYRQTWPETRVSMICYALTTIRDSLDTVYFDFELYLAKLYSLSEFLHKIFIELSFDTYHNYNSLNRSGMRELTSQISMIIKWYLNNGKFKIESRKHVFDYLRLHVSTVLNILLVSVPFSFEKDDFILPVTF